MRRYCKGILMHRNPTYIGHNLSLFFLLMYKKVAAHSDSITAIASHRTAIQTTITIRLICNSKMYHEIHILYCQVSSMINVALQATMENR